jgi:hypothetical protein
MEDETLVIVDAENRRHSLAGEHQSNDFVTDDL